MKRNKITAKQAGITAQKFWDWFPPVNLGPVVNSGFAETFPVVSKSGRSLYFSSSRPGTGGLDIRVSQRASADEPWGEPKILGPNVNTEFNEDSAALSRDWHWLFFASNRPGGPGRDRSLGLLARPHE